jgi:3-methyladenine DNA glycosylase/8-oxoguanine DNA glycosylase
MSDDIFEGDDNSVFLKEHATDLDLFAVSNTYKSLWKLPARSDLHQAISLLISKNAPYDMTKKIMKKISDTIGNRDITIQNFVMKDSKLKEWGLSNDKIQGIRKILSLPEITAKSLCSVKEGGIYLVKAFKIFQEEDDDIFLYEDYTVRKNLGILFYRDKPLSESESRKLSQYWQGHRSQISYFLYRLTSKGADKILEDKELDDSDFH